MDITKYRMYIRDVQLTDSEFAELIKDVIDDIARDTKIFKELFGFTIESCKMEYDMNLLFTLHSRLKDTKITDITLTPTYSENSSLEFIRAVVKDNKDGLVCSTTTEDDIVVEIETEKDITNTYISTLDIQQIIYNYEDNSRFGTKSNVRSVSTRYFDQASNDLYIKNIISLREDGFNEEDAAYSIPVVGIACIVPNLDFISEEIERIIKQAIIAGIKYFVSDLYMNTSNEQVSNILYQRYYAKKKQLVYDYPIYVSNLLRYNSEWNK